MTSTDPSFTAPAGVELIAQPNGGRIPQSEYDRLLGHNKQYVSRYGVTQGECSRAPQLMAFGIPYSYNTYGGAAFAGRSCHLYTHAHADRPRQIQAAIHEAGRQGFTRIYLLDTLAA